MSINRNRSLINSFKPDKIDPDGTLYYSPFKLVPTINLLIDNNKSYGTPTKTNPNNNYDLRYAWESHYDDRSNVIGFQILSKSDDEYLPVGDLIVNGPQGVGQKGDISKAYNNYDLTPIINYYQYFADGAFADQNYFQSQGWPR